MKKLVFSFLVLAGIFMFAGCGNQTRETIDETTNETSGEEMNQETFNATMEEVYKKWWKITCSMTTTDEWIKMSGMLYVDGKKMRSDVKSTMEGMAIEMHALIKDGYSYSWTNSSNEGRKTPYDDADMEEGMNDTETDSDEETPMKFSCKKWVKWVDFDLPSSIEFKDMNY